MLYKVTWEIEIDACSPQSAARRALDTLRDPSGFAPYFSVRDEDGTESEIDMEAYSVDGEDE